jgi:glycolate oxidase
MHPSLVRSLERIVGKPNVRALPAQRLAYSFDATFQQSLPTAAVLPATTDEVSRVMSLLSEAGIPVVARGAATGLAGGAVPTMAAVVLNLARMRQIKELDPGDGIVVTEPGVITAELHRTVERAGMFYPPDPASLRQCTIGGNLACNAGGPRCLKYGVTRDYVRSLEVVMADGTVLQTGSRVLKSSTGYALNHLFVGSEGTLGVITEATLRVIPLPRGRATGMAYFDDLDTAVLAVTETFRAGITPSSLELFDRETLALAEAVTGLEVPADVSAALLIEVDAPDQTTATESLKTAAAAMRGNGAISVRVALDDREAEILWRARRSVSGALGRIAKKKLGEDIVVPRTKIPEMVRAIVDIAQDTGLRIPIFGHAGDGNLHPNILFDTADHDDLSRVQAAAIAIFETAISLGGALSGEHGVGTLKREFLARNLGDATVDTMRLVKAALDPHGLLNPGKVFPDNGESGWKNFLEGLTPMDARVEFA